MKYILIASVCLLFTGCEPIPLPTINNDIVRIESPAEVYGSIFTNGGWKYVGKFTIPSNFVAGPFIVTSSTN